MADEIEKIAILSIELDVSQFSEAADKAAADLEQLLVKQSLLRAESKQGTVEYAALSDQISKTRKALKDNAAAAQNVTKLQKENTGSIVEMRKELSAATLQYNNLSKAERDNANVGGKLKTQIKGLSDELKKNESAIGDNRRNVGNYQQALEGALNQTNLFGGSLSQLSGILQSGGILGVALAGTIALAKGLSDAFMSVDANADLVEQKMAGVNASLDTFTGTIGKGLGGENGGFFGGLADAAKGFTFFLNAITGTLPEAFKASALASDLTKKVQLLNDVQRENSKIIAENNVIIAENLAKSKNKGIEDEERIAILEQAGRLEKQNLAIEVENADKRLAIIQGFNTLSRRAGTITDENKQAEVDAFNTVQKLREESLSLQERINARISNIAEAANKEADDLAKKQTDDLIKELNEREKEYKRLIDEQKKLEKSRIDYVGKLQEESKRDRIIFLNGLAEEERIITQATNARQELDLKNQLANREITEREFADKMIQIQIESFERELFDLETRAGREIGLEDEVAQQKIKIATFIADAKIKENERVTKDAKEESDKQIEIAQDQAKITEDFIQGIGQAFGDALTEQGLQVESFAQNVLLVVLDTLEKTITASIASATATSLAQPDSVATFGITGIARAAILTGLIKAAFAVVKSQIGKDSGAKFAKGGLPGQKSFVLGGNPHSMGGTKFIGSDGTRFEAEQGELLAIVNKRSTGMLNYLSSINKAGGGVDFFKSSPSSYMQDGGFAARAVSTSTEQQNQNSLPPIFVLVEDINSAQGTKAKVESRARF